MRHVRPPANGATQGLAAWPTVQDQEFQQFLAYSVPTCLCRAKYKRLLQRVAALNAPSSGGAPFEGGSITGAGNSAWDLQAEMDNMLSRTESCR